MSDKNTTVTTQETAEVVAAEGKDKKLSKREIVAARIEAQAQHMVGLIDHDEVNKSGKAEFGRAAYEHVMTNHGFDMDTTKRFHDAEHEFAASGTRATHILAGQAMRANAEMKTVTGSFQMVGRDHMDVSANRDGTTDVRMVRHAVNSTSGSLKEIVSGFAAAQAIFEARESSAGAVAAAKAEK